MSFGAAPPGAPQIDFGNINTSASGSGEWTAVHTGLAVATGLLSMTALGYFVSGGKTSKQIRMQRKFEAMQRQQKMRAALGGGAPRAPGPADPMDAMVAPQADPRAEAAQREAYERQKQAYEAQEAQQMLQMVLMRADQLIAQGAREQAAELYMKCVSMLPEALPDYLDVCMELTNMACRQLLASGLADKALVFLEAFKPGLGEDAKPQLLAKYNKSLANVYVKLGRPEALDLLVYNAHQEKAAHGDSSSEYASQLVALAGYKLKLNEFDDAIELVSDALPVLVNNNAGPLTRDIYGAYLLLAKCHIAQGHLKEAEEVRQVVESQADPDDITFHWHLSHLASVYSDFDCVEESIALHNRILEKFREEGMEGKNPRLVSLVGNTMNELAMTLYNDGRVEEANELLAVVREKKWGLLTACKYVSTRNSTILFSPEPNDDFSGTFKLSLELKPATEVGMVLEVRIENSETEPEVERFVVDEKMQRAGLEYTSKKYRRFEQKAYDVTTSVYESEEAEMPIFMHLQMIPSSLNTMNVETWAELERMYNAK